jgi:type II secretory pathway component PulK
MRTKSEVRGAWCVVRDALTKHATRNTQHATGDSDFGLRTSERASVLIIVLWIAFGLVSLALYFADSMNFELRASDNRVSAQAADQAIEGAARYISYLLGTQAANGSNGFVPDPASYQREAVAVGEAHFWLIGRETNNAVGPGRVFFGLTDEAAKLNLNYATSNHLTWLPRMTTDLTQAILDWRDTNGTGPTVTYYAMQQPAYLCKNDPFETVDEVRLLYGAEMDVLLGEDANRNGVLDPNENDENQNNQLDPGVLDYFTVYTREPNTNSDGSARINITTLSRDSSRLSGLLQTNFGAARANQILLNLGLVSAPSRPGSKQSGSSRSGGGSTLRSPFALYSKSQMTQSEFARIVTNLTTVTGPFLEGRVNVNTASAAVLACLFSGDTAAAEQLVNYRQTNPGNLGTIAWVIEALGQSYSSALQSLAQGDYITTQSYQFTADVAALGPHGRGYRRVKFVFDTSAGAPQLVYRQDLTHLGWALGKEVREKWVGVL